MLQQAVNNRTQIADIKRRYDSGVITREQAKVEAQPILDRINGQVETRTKELNKKYGLNKRATKLDFINAMRNSY